MIDGTPIITTPHITDLSPIVMSNNLTAKLKLKGTKRLHRQVIRNNTLGIMPDGVMPCDRTATAPDDTTNACNQHSDPDGIGILQHDPHTTYTDEICLNANQLQTLCKSYGAPSDRSNNIKLQKVDA